MTRKGFAQISEIDKHCHEPISNWFSSIRRAFVRAANFWGRKELTTWAQGLNTTKVTWRYAMLILLCHAFQVKTLNFLKITSFDGTVLRADVSLPKAKGSEKFPAPRQEFDNDQRCKTPLEQFWRHICSWTSSAFRECSGFDHGKFVECAPDRATWLPKKNNRTRFVIFSWW